MFYFGKQYVFNFSGVHVTNFLDEPITGLQCYVGLEIKPYPQHMPVWVFKGTSTV